MSSVWATGDYAAMVEMGLLGLGRALCDAVEAGPGQRILDVAAGTGNSSIEAASRGANVVASDLTPELLEQGKARAAAAGLELEWVEADAEQLPFGEAEFDTVISSIGVMFAPHHQVAADELARVCKPGGTIGVLSWTPEGMVGAMFRTLGAFNPPPPPGFQPPVLWGSEAHLGEIFGDLVEWTSQTRHVLEIERFAAPGQYADYFRANFGPMIAARAFAESSGRLPELDAAFDGFVAEWNLDPQGARFEQEYLLAVGTRR